LPTASGQIGLALGVASTVGLVVLAARIIGRRARL
jgi:hypothetical protein